MLGGVETIPVGKLVTPRISASTVDPKIPNKMAPLTFLIRRKAINIIPKKKTIDWLLFIFPSERIVPWSFTIIPALENPISDINNPIPTDTAFFRVYGIASNIFSLILNKLISINIIPSKKTAVKANCQVWPIFKTTV